MGKKGVAQISGVVKPIVGETYTYSVTGWYPDTEPEKRNPNNVTWELFKQRSLGKFTTTNIRKKGISSFTFGEKAVGSVYKLQAYLYEPEGGGLIITPQPAKIPKIEKVELFYVDDKKGSTFSFMEKLRARAYCVNMLKKELVFTLWEDDAKGKGHNANNKLIETRKAKVNENGIAVTEFMLTKALMKKAMQGETDPKQLEFYVTVEYYSHKKHATDNVNINNPFPPIKGEVPAKPRGVPKAKGSPAASKPASKKEERGIGQIISEKWDELWDWWETPGTIKKDQSPTVQKPDGRSPAIVKGEKKPTSTCICKEQYKDLIWGGKVSCEFRKKVIQICAELWGESRKMEMANGLMAVMKVETWGSFKAHHREGFKSANDNPKDLTISSFHKDSGSKSSRAVGLIQFTQDALEGMNEFPKSTPATKGTQPRYDALNRLKLSYAQMGEIRQLDKVKKYFESAKSKIKTPEDIYLHVFAPKGVGQKDDFLLYAKDTIEYKNNNSVDKDNNGIQRKEILARFYESKNEGIKNKTSNFTCGISDKKDDDVKATGIVTYHIYADGKIEKHIPKKIKSGYEQKYKYVFHDKENKEHEICIVDFIFANKRNNGITISSIPKGYTKTYSYPRGGNAQTAYVYPNGDICVKGTRYGFKKYPKGTGKVELVRMKDGLSYNNGNVKIYYSFKSSQRRYCNPESYAGLIGALATLGRTDVLCTGMCFEDATSYPSVTHPNGDSADTAYYSTLAVEQKKVNAFKHFNFKNIYRGKTGWYPNLIGTKYSKGHEDHLHAGDFDSNIVKTIKE